MPNLTSRHLRILLLAVLAAIVGLGALQAYNAFEGRQIALRAAQEGSVPVGIVEKEKARQEMIQTRLANLDKTLFWSNFASPLNASITVILSILGAFGTATAYLEAREKERQDRIEAQRKEREDRSDAREKEREERLAAGFSEALSLLVASEARQQLVGVASLTFFIAADRAEYHEQALAALLAAARTDTEHGGVRQAVRLAVEQAARVMAPATLVKLSWQGVRLAGIDLSGRDLSGIDLKDAELQDAQFRGARLIGTNFTNARMQGAKLPEADLSAADLTYADLAGGSVRDAILAGANLFGIKVLNLDLAGCRIDDSVRNWPTVPWESSLNWRDAELSAAIREELERRYGSAVASAPEVLMLMWEMPPFVAGGTWTACYHLVRKLHGRGARVKVVVPWMRDRLVDSPFGVDVAIIDMGMEPPAAAQGTYGGSVLSPLASANPYARLDSYPGPYAGSVYSGYASYGQAISPYGQILGSTAYGTYGSYAGMQQPGSALYRLIEEFRRRVASQLVDQKPTIIHAHDWITFDAARAAARRMGVPWIAHFHSTEAERNPDREDELILRIEQSALDSAARIVTPSHATKDRMTADYIVAAGKIEVIPNLMSESASSAEEAGRFETRRVVFLGRLSRQKGIDRFVAVAEAARRLSPARPITFELFGEGPEAGLASSPGVRWRGPLAWAARADAFRGASAVLVPSRYEPFGMVVLEAMQYCVPVLYPSSSGAAEVLHSGIRIDPADNEANAATLVRLLDNLASWEEVVGDQLDEVDGYPARNYEDLLVALWQAAAGAGAAPAAGAA